MDGLISYHVVGCNKLVTNWFVTKPYLLKNYIIKELYWKRGTNLRVDQNDPQKLHNQRIILKKRNQLIKMHISHLSFPNHNHHFTDLVQDSYAVFKISIKQLPNKRIPKPRRRPNVFKPSPRQVTLRSLRSNSSR